MVYFLVTSMLAPIRGHCKRKSALERTDPAWFGECLKPLAFFSEESVHGGAGGNAVHQGERSNGYHSTERDRGAAGRLHRPDPGPLPGDVRRGAALETSGTTVAA